LKESKEPWPFLGYNPIILFEKTEEMSKNPESGWPEK
jgi:hypothetical protein